MSGFTLQWSRTIPPSATVPCAPVPPSSPRPSIARDSRPRRTSASAKYFFIRSIFSAGRAGAALPAPCTMHVHPRVHKVRRLDWTGLFGYIRHRGQRSRTAGSLTRHGLTCFNVMGSNVGHLVSNLVCEISSRLLAWVSSLGRLRRPQRGAVGINVGLVFFHVPREIDEEILVSYRRATARRNELPPVERAYTYKKSCVGGNFSSSF